MIYNPTGKPLAAAEVARLLPGVDGYIAGLDAIDRAALLALSQVIATPHLGAQTGGAVNNMGRLSLQDCLAVLRGEPPRFRVV